MQNCSLKRRMLLVLIALLFLPAVSAFAVNNTFPVTVLDDQNLPVPGAEVIVYDSSVYWGAKSTGYTDSTGKVNVVVGDLYQTADSLTNPSHNIGIVAIPANASNSTALAFGRTTLRFYNVFGVDALAPMSTVRLNPGCKLTVSPKVIEDNVELSAIRTSLKINLPDVPQWVKTFELMPGSIGETNPSWQIYWPKNTPFVSEFWEDWALNDPTKAGYYQRKSDYFQIADETEKAFSLVHTRLQKGRVDITSNTDTTYFELRWNKSADFNYYEGSTYLTGSGTIYLPKNTYYFVVKPQLTGTTTPVASEPLPPPSSTVPLPSVIDPSTLKAPVVLFANVAVGDEPAAMSFNAASGKSVSGVVALEGVTSPTYAPQVFLSAQQKVGDLWIEVDSTWPTDAAGSYCFGHLFDPTKEYRIITKSSSNPSAEGIVDYYSNPAKCFANHHGVSMTVTVDTTYNISLPQVAGVEFVLSYPVGYIKDALFAYLPTESENWSNRIYDSVFVDQNRRFVPFAETDRPIIVRADYVYGNESLGEVVSKVSIPVVPEAGKTTVVQLAFDPTKVVKVQSDVKMADTGLRYLATNVRAWASPVINFNGKEFNASEIFGLGYQYGVFNKIFNPIDQSIFEFSVEKGTSYQIGAVEAIDQYQVRPLMGFVPYHELVQVSETQTSPFVRDILLDEGNSFLGHVAVDGVDQASTTLFIKLDPVYSDYSQGEMYPRQGVVTTDDKGKFLVSGLTPGRYMAELNLEFMPATYTVYNSQTMPLIVREIFVDSNATAHPAEGIAPTVLAFNLNSSLIGWLNGLVVDESGKPVAGAQIEICRNNPNNASTSPYYNRGKPVFYCLTNASGSIVTPDPGNSLVPLEAGSYDIFVKGLNYPNGPLYEFSGYDSRPFATVKISAGGMVTPVKVVLRRKFAVSGILTENESPAVNIYGQVYNEDGVYVTYFMTKQDGSFMFEGGLLPGQYLVAINIEDQNGRRFYLESLNISADMANLTMNLDPAKLNTVNLLARDSNGQILNDVGGQIMLFADTALGENSPRWYATWAAADLTGKITVSLPTPPSANSAYGFVGNPRWFETFETAADGSVKSVTKMFNPPGVVMLDVPATADKTVIWQAPSKVTVNALLPAGANEKKYIGVLMTEEFFMAGKQEDKVGSEPYHPPMTMPGHGDNARNTFYAPCEGGKFVFDNILPGKDYVFVAYEGFAELHPDMIRWTYYMPAPALFRHFSEAFAVATEPVEISETFSALAPVVLACSQKPELLDIPDAIVGLFTTDKLNTIGKSAWPILEFPPMQTDDSMVPEILDLPVGYAFRISVNPGMPGFLAKNLENLVVPPEGRTVDILLNELPKLSGTVVRGDMPVNGYLLLIPEGVDPTAPTFSPIKVPVNNGSYTAFLKSGFYDCYAIPFTGATTLASITMAAAATTAPAINIKPAVVVSGKVAVATAGTELPLVGSSIMVMRKRAADSTMTDGAKLMPYPAVNGSHVIKCGPSGEFSFLAEPEVNYYVQAIVPAGFNPGGLKFVPVTSQAVNLPIILGEGGKIAGNVNVPARIEARPVGTSAIGDQFSTGSVFYAEALFPEMIDGVERYAFTIVGLDANMLYNITVLPMDGVSSIEKRLNVDPKNTTPLGIDLNPGNTVRGQLIDAATGQNLQVANVPVNLAMTLPVVITPAPLTSNVASSYRMRQNVLASGETDYGLDDVILSGMWTQTDQYGRFEFKGVPSFITAFVKTETGFSSGGVSYARARTEDLAPNFVNNSMNINLKARLGGKVIGRLIDNTGKPLPYGMIEAYMGLEWAEASVDSTGNFSIEGLIPGANYIVNIVDIPGIAPWFKSGVLVEPGKATDLGAIVVYKAVMTFGMASGTQALKKRSFNYGMPEDVELAVLAVDGNRPVTDDDLLTGRYRHSITGFGEIYLDPFSDYDEYGFSMFTRPGKTNVGVVLSKDSDNGASTLITWGWRPGLNVPTEEQLDYGSYEITSGTPPLMFPQEFGAIEGTIKHSTDAVATFSPETAVIALYPVDVVNSVSVVRPVPFPTAVTSPVNGKWYINDVPVGIYRVKVVTQKYGTFFDKDVVIVNNLSTGQAVRHDILLNNDVVKITGKVVLGNSAKTPVSAAKVSLILKKLATTTAADGTFAFYLPKGDFMIPQIEISKPGIQTMRFFEVAGVGTTTPLIASAGALIASDTSLGEFVASGSVGSVEVTVMSGRDNKISVGAEVALVYKEADRNVWIVAEAQATDENGKARFASVPVGREVSFRARAHYHVPTIATKTVDVGAAAVLTITMPAADPKVFYTGVVEPQAENGKYEVKAMFDFDQVVLKTDVGLRINESARTPTKYPDEIFNRITSMYYQGIETVVENGSLIASVSYNSKDIGAFRLLSNAVFRKEYAVDPLSADGFTGRQTDASGTMLPTGITVPPGFLSPEIDSFSLEVASPSTEMQSANIELDDPNLKVVPQFAGPTFSFNFGQGQSNFGAGTASGTQGLFEITIAYTAGTVVEPRWYDVANKRWSKVGIIPDSIRKDYPQPGYMTFKVDHLTDFAVLKNVVGGSAGIRWDFNGDGRATLADLAIGLAYYLAPDPDSISLSDLTTSANAFYSKVNSNTPALIKPSAIADDLNNDQRFSLNDIALFLAWYLAADQTATGDIENAARGFYGNLKGGLANTPGTSVSR